MSDFRIKNGVLVKYVGNGGDVVIPDSVTAIGVKAFKGCSSLMSIRFPTASLLSEMRRSLTAAA